MYEELGAEIGRLVTVKQKAYGDSFGRAGEVLRILYPNGVPDESLDDALVVVRVIDKLFRIATDKDALGEDPWRDIAGYALLGASRRKPYPTEVGPDDRSESEIAADNDKWAQAYGYHSFLEVKDFAKSPYWHGHRDDSVVGIEFRRRCS